MNVNLRLLLLPLLIILFACEKEAKQEKLAPFQISDMGFNLEESFRGLYAVDEHIVWASGTNGVIMRTTDGGENWLEVNILNSRGMDFRSIWAFDKNRAITMSAGTPTLIYKTKNGGAKWDLVYSDRSEDAFFNVLAFWDDAHGIAFGDPKAGVFSILTTSDSGNTWQDISKEILLGAYEGEAGFAASSSCLRVLGDSHVWYATGGSKARILFSADKGRNWIYFNTPVIQGKASEGIYSISFKNSNHGIAVGGDYANPDSNSNISAFTVDGGVNWTLAKTQARGYRSCVEYVSHSENTYIAVGINGVDYTLDGGAHWIALDTNAYHTVRFAPSGNKGWLIGKGKASIVNKKASHF